jgi:hypothetical protein
MLSNAFSARKICGVLGLALVAASLAAAQQPPAQQPPAQQPPVPFTPMSLAGKTAEQAFKNIQVFKGTPADQLVMTMHGIAGQLGVDCEFCHVGTTGDAAAMDDKAPKNTARKMIQMVDEINKSTFGGRQVVTCYTCHQGHTEPVGTPVLPMSGTMLTEEPKIPPGPSVDEILAKYVQALGGEAAIRKVTSRLITATHDLPSGAGGKVPIPSLVEQYRKAPDLVVNVDHTPNFTVSDGFDGTTAWAQNMAGVVSDVASATDQARLKRAADFYESLDLKQEYMRMAARGIERVNDRDCYVVLGYPQGDSLERLYFDTQTGLLLRRITTLPTSVGAFPFQVDYDDYRDSGSGVKIPFWIRTSPITPRSELETQSITRVQKVQDNVPIDGGKFVKPPSNPAPAAPPAPPPPAK